METKPGPQEQTTTGAQPNQAQTQAAPKEAARPTPRPAHVCVILDARCYFYLYYSKCKGRTACRACPFGIKRAR